VRMQPALGVHAPGIGAMEEIVRPACVIDSGGLGWARDVGFAATSELDLRAGSAIGTSDEQHAVASVTDGCRRRFVDQTAGAKAVERERGIDGVWLAFGDGVRKHMT
jgi:hypothetical protein